MYQESWEKTKPSLIHEIVTKMIAQSQVKSQRDLSEI